ncbi:MAG TPA: hypothetical protein VE287_00365 [Actinopolymorphaceae bacterium]|nr:hypothetical protein [Actinopolymorphaceae bacterium]
MYIGSPEFATLRQLPQLGISSLAATPRIPTPSQGSAIADLSGSRVRASGHRFRRFMRRFG